MRRHSRTEELGNGMCGRRDNAATPTRKDMPVGWVELHRFVEQFIEGGTLAVCLRKPIHGCLVPVYARHGGLLFANSIPRLRNSDGNLTDSGDHGGSGGNDCLRLGDCRYFCRGVTRRCRATG